MCLIVWELQVTDVAEGMGRGRFWLLYEVGSSLFAGLLCNGVGVLLPKRVLVEAGEFALTPQLKDASTQGRQRVKVGYVID